MSLNRQMVLPDWKEFLRIGEALLNQETATDQSRLIRQTLKTRCKAVAGIWLARPYYPLPGEPQKKLLPDPSAPDLVQQCFQLADTVVVRNPAGDGTDGVEITRELCLPLKTQNHLLGVLHVKSTLQPGFSQKDIDFISGLSAHAALAMQIFRQVAIKNWRLEQLSLVRNVIARVANLRDLDEFCRQTTTLIQETFGYYFVAIFTKDERSEELRYRAGAGPKGIAANLEDQISFCLGEGIIGTVAETGEEIIAPEVENEPRYRHIPALKKTRSEVAVPLRIGDRILGVLDLQSSTARAFHEHDMNVIRALADNIAIAVEGVQLFSGVQKRAMQISALLEISHVLTSILDFDLLLEEVVQSIQRNFQYPYVHIFSVHLGRKKIFYEAGSGARSQALEQEQVSYDLNDPCGIIPWVARSGQTLLANDVDQEPLYRPSPLPPTNTRSELAIPLAFSGEVLGVLDLQSDVVNGFDVKDIPLLEALGSSVAIAMRNARLYHSEVWRRQVADSFREISSQVSANVALDDLLEKILNELKRNLPCDATAIYLINENSYEEGPPGLHLAAAQGIDPEKINLVLTEDSEAKAFLEKALFLDHPLIRTPDDPVGPLGKALDFPPNYSSIAAPLRAGDQSLGVLTLAHHTEGRYGHEAGLISMTFANNAAVAIQNAKLFAAAQEQAWISTILLQIAEATQSNLSVEELLETMARLTPLLVGVKKCAFFTWDENRQVFILKSQYGLDEALIGDDELTFGPSLPVVARLLDTREPVFIQDPFLEMNLSGADFQAQEGTLVIIPLLARGRLFGAYLVGHQADSSLHVHHAFDQQTLALLQGIAKQTAVALENLQLIQASQEEAYVTAVMLQVAEAVVSQNELDDILDTIVHLLPILVGIDSCAIFLWDEHLEAYRTTKVFTGTQQDDLLLEGETFQLNEFPMLDAVRESNQLMACKTTVSELSFNDWRELVCLIPQAELELEQDNNVHWVIGVPLSVKGEFFGVLMAKETRGIAALHGRRLEILTGVAQQVSLAIQNERLKREMVQRERLEREIQVARHIQRTFLPSFLPRIKGWEMDIHWQTAREVGGDFYDIFSIGKDKLGIVVADVADKGIPAALYMTVARTLIRAFSQKAESPARVLERVNRSLSMDSPDGLFVTAIFAILNTADGTLTYANAGHNLPVHFHNHHRKATTLPKGGTALGISRSTRLTDHKIQIEAGDSLVFYTDGVTESFSPDGDPFGEERLLQAINAAPNSQPGELMEHLKQVLEDFRQGSAASDDMTIVLIHRSLSDSGK